MNYLVRFTAYHWDNHQGGSGQYINHTLLVKIEKDDNFGWQGIHDAIQANLKTTRVFDQTVYSKVQKEYIITEAILL